MKTLSIKSLVALAFLGFALALAGCDRPVNFKQAQFNSKTEMPTNPEFPQDPETPVEAKSLVINNQDLFTKDAVTFLKLDATNVLEMYVTENADCGSGGQWENYSKTKTWTLKKINQVASVYAKFRTLDYETACVFDEITHDDQAPVIQITSSPASSISVFSATYTFTVADSLSGLDSVLCTFDAGPGVACTDAISYANLLPGVHQLKITAKDKAGNSSEANHNFEITENRQTQIITIGAGTGKADILFVVNNSFSMFSELRGPVTDRFSSFISNLKDTDYNISVTTSDSVGVHAYEAGGFADLLRTAVPGTGIVAMPRSKVITPDTKNGSKLFVTTLMRPEAICVQVSSGMCPHNGSAYQEAIHSSLLALDRPENKIFFRSDASLHLVIISDDDEGAGNLTDRNGNILERAPAHNRPETLIKTVKSRWPNKEFKAHSVIKPKGKICNAFEVQAADAPIYQNLANLTGGKIADICNEYDFTETNAIARSIATSKPTYTLTCDPVDLNKDGVTDAADLSLTYSPVATPMPIAILKGRTVSFDPSPGPGTEVRISYVCP